MREMKKTLLVTTIITIFLVSVIVGFYLSNQEPKPIQSLSNFYLGDSRIFVVSANATYGTYPGPTVTSNPIGLPIAENGEPCVIINVTLRNDYSNQHPAPGRSLTKNSTLVYVALTANIYNGNKQVNAKDITNANQIASAGTNKAFTELNFGESTTLKIYLATNNTDITSFQIIPRYIGLLTPP
jgi:hypothetical protein